MLQLPSVPMPTLTPASIMACSGAIPHASLLLDTGQEATLQWAACRVCHATQRLQTTGTRRTPRLHELDVRGVAVHAVSTDKRIGEEAEPVVVLKGAAALVRQVPAALPLLAHALRAVVHLVQRLVHVRVHQQAVLALEVAAFDQRSVAHGVRRVRANRVPARMLQQTFKEGDCPKVTTNI